MPTAKLDVRAVKFESAYPDGVEPITVERAIFENSPKPFLLESFWRYLFSKR